MADEPFDSLPDATDAPDESYPDAAGPSSIEESTDKRPEDKPRPGYCVTCGEPIVREPGTRGRLPKYHPDCKPKPGFRVANPPANSKAEKEADQAVAAFRSLATKTCLMLSAVEQYDAFAIMATLPQLCENLRGVLINYPRLRKEFLTIGSGGSLLGLIVTVLMLGLSLSAHHNLLPRQYKDILERAPIVLHNIQQKMAEGEATLTEMMREKLFEAKRKTDGGK